MPTAKKSTLLLLLSGGAALLLALDLATKRMAELWLQGKGVVPVVGDFAVLVFARNQGAFLSLGSALPPGVRIAVFVIFPIAALALIGSGILGKGMLGSRRPMLEMAGALLMMAGGVGNLIDRVAHGTVRDFLNFGIGNFRTGVMNLADLYLAAAIIMLIVSSLRRPSRETEASGRPDQGA
jgi:signal peptidase II